MKAKSSKIARPPVAVTVVVPVKIPSKSLYLTFGVVPLTTEKLTVTLDASSLAARFPKRSLISTTGEIIKASPVRAPTGCV